MRTVLTSLALLGLALPLAPAQEKERDKPSDTRPAVDPLHAAVRVNGKNASCGTIIKVDDDGNGENTTAYVLTTGHMQKRQEVTVEIFYRKGKKLDAPEKVTGELVCLVENNKRGIDFSIVQVSLSGNVRDYAACKLAKDVTFNRECVSIGCDGGIEPKAFNVTPTGWRIKNADIWVRHKTDEVSNGGRSGGGLFHNGELIGVYWGSYNEGADKTDRGTGMATSAPAVRKALEANKLDHLLD